MSSVIVLVPAAIIESHRVGSLNNRNEFFPVLDPGKSKIKVSVKYGILFMPVMSIL